MSGLIESDDGWIDFIKKKKNKKNQIWDVGKKDALTLLFQCLFAAFP